ncbi:TAT-variant-translocated molybdopterin oxidoreductase [Fimbriimonas ginsengisoli]|uniref:Fe-S-cluster-containing hydrogenase components 1-like protein n=1 Tax=Fimbriimonas ginsengisoli Gsoil 348 TaxID=661478 RepID=A0A068NVH2_FIMGI|nr:TAT-variant-translocated molybdopterin oxidoreductase [Fimbriimonas ginsengisoli]AIE85549.1 Fe-S-cluster-containing hydrogenase components 1-like protein [Fimbriimonas ginsengisoli Gsoil 348]
MDTNTEQRFDVEAAREQLAGQGGKRYWRTLSELADTPEFQLWVEDEFPNRRSIMQINRRDLLKFMGASMALAGLSGCRGVFLPEDKVVPYVRQPEELVPGKSLYYASAITLGGYATGVLVEQQEGRPIKIEGNPEHPASLGALDSISQAQVLGFYDPDRAGSVLNRANLGFDADLSSWELFEASIKKLLADKQKTGGASIRILTGSVTSPTFIGLMTRFLAKYPAVKWHAYEPVGRANAHEGSRLALGGAYDTIYDFSKANVVFSLDGDFLSSVSNPAALVNARQFAEKRRVKGYEGTMNRLYAIQSTPTLAGAMADHCWTVRGSEVYAHALALAAALGVPGVSAAGGSSISAAHLAAVAKDLTDNAGASIVITGDHQPPQVHALVQAINSHLRNFGATVTHIPAVDVTANPAGSPVAVGDLATLVQDLNGNAVDTLIVMEANPVYDAPADLNFRDAMLKARTKIRFGAYDDETSLWSEWHLPLAHELEAWGDARAFDGTLSVIQPLIAPLYEGRSAIEFLATLLDEPKGGYDLVRDHWHQSGVFGSPAPAGSKFDNAFEKNWRTVVHDGLVKNSAVAPATVTVTLDAASLPAPQKVEGIEVNFRPDPCVYDGRYTNNGWLMELPRPLTKLTWDNAAIMGPKMAKSLGVADDDVVQLTLNGKNVKAPVFVQPGHPDQAITVHLGFGRTRGGVVASVGDNGEKIDTVTSSINDKMGGGGFDGYALRTQAAPYFQGGLTVTVLSRNSYDLATTQGHQPLDGNHIPQFEGDEREVVVEHNLATFLAKGKEIEEKRKEEYKELNDQNLFPDQIFQYEGLQWGMTIDLNTCIGCNACVTACQAENNIPVVGKEQVARHREMHWIRIDRYYSGGDDDPAVSWQPVMCVQCEKAPCEPVCPVAATVHSHEGLNQMTYNRCVGTRYCSNNCPYKVRRFNYLNFTDNQKQFDVHLDEKPRIPLLRMLNNPNVTVRGRGVMEKCTYCTQRINEVRIEAKKQNRDPLDGEIVTACQQACPTQTIVFGNIADPKAKVTELRHDPRAYLLLEELLTRPRTSHLAKLRNPNPEIHGAAAAGATEGA